MKLISCENCGTVIDTDRLIEPDVYNHDTGKPLSGSSRYNNESREYEPIIECPVCHSDIFYNSGDF